MSLPGYQVLVERAAVITGLANDWMDLVDEATPNCERAIRYADSILRLSEIVIAYHRAAVIPPIPEPPPELFFRKGAQLPPPHTKPVRCEEVNQSRVLPAAPEDPVAPPSEPVRPGPVFRDAKMCPSITASGPGLTAEDERRILNALSPHGEKDATP